LHRHETQEVNMKNIRVKEAATYVGLSKSSLDKLRCFGGGPKFFKLGRAVVYSTDDLDAWMHERVRTSTWGGNDNIPAAMAAA
jgi:predicted DNA-binding transcriptional regulator AlpA